MAKVMEYECPFSPAVCSKQFFFLSFPFFESLDGDDAEECEEEEEDDDEA